jgi:hypothetical protein
MRYYENKFPEVDQLVMVQVKQIAEMGAYVKLVSSWLEFGLDCADDSCVILVSFPCFLPDYLTLNLSPLRVSAARIRQHRRHDLALGAVAKADKVGAKVD